MNDIIKLETLELQLVKEFLVDDNNIKKIQCQIEDLRKNVYDFSTLEGIKEAKELKTKANKFVKALKDFCEPLEADGKKIAIRAEQIKSETEKRIAGQEAEAKRQAELKENAESERLAKNKDHQAKIHNEILEDLKRIVITSDEELNDLIKTIANSKIRNLKIIY